MYVTILFIYILIDLKSTNYVYKGRFVYQDFILFKGLIFIKLYRFTITRFVLVHLNLIHRNQLIRTLVMIVKTNVDYYQTNISIFFVDYYIINRYSFSYYFRYIYILNFF